jgi:hypothetical protein
MKIILIFLLISFLNIIFTQQNEQIKILFNIIDKDKNGILSETELSNFFLTIYSEPDEMFSEKNLKETSIKFIHHITKNTQNLTFNAFENKFNLRKIKSDTEPQQVHLSITENNKIDSGEYAVMWATKAITKSSLVQYGIGNLSQTEKGIMYTYDSSPTYPTDSQLHLVILKNLRPGQFYKYRVGNGIDGWSPIFNFTTKGFLFYSEFRKRLSNKLRIIC